MGESRTAVSGLEKQRFWQVLSPRSWKPGNTRGRGAAPAQGRRHRSSLESHWCESTSEAEEAGSGGHCHWSRKERFQTRAFGLLLFCPSGPQAHRTMPQWAVEEAVASAGSEGEQGSRAPRRGAGAQGGGPWLALFVSKTTASNTGSVCSISCPERRFLLSGEAARSQGLASGKSGKLNPFQQAPRHTKPGWASASEEFPPFGLSTGHCANTLPSPQGVGVQKILM